MTFSPSAETRANVFSACFNAGFTALGALGVAEILTNQLPPPSDFIDALTLPGFFTASEIWSGGFFGIKYAEAMRSMGQRQNARGEHTLNDFAKGLTVTTLIHAATLGATYLSANAHSATFALALAPAMAGALALVAAAVLIIPHSN